MKEFLILRLRNAAIAIDELEGPTQHNYGNSEVLAADAITRARAR